MRSEAFYRVTTCCNLDETFRINIHAGRFCRFVGHEHLELGTKNQDSCVWMDYTEKGVKRAQSNIKPEGSENSHYLVSNSVIEIK